MTDILSPRQRSERMSRISAKDMKPELAVRRLVHGMGYRYRLHRRDLPGKPDMTFGSRRKVIFVHGCFWHRHPGCRLARLPKSRLDYWLPKLDGNRDRDLRNQETLRREGWGVLVIWECEIADKDALKQKIRGFLDD
uniref:Very short patch repair endonuclease n=1 Tax=Candidatus Kentrum sp. TC TaxID=2126339 RepID=A0A450ZSJ3_9GAMM|nr:MAG: DNA mismatch endonuclease, patch repair protein [Candidatus Kentron sp. TC]